MILYRTRSFASLCWARARLALLRRSHARHERLNRIERPVGFSEVFALLTLGFLAFFMSSAFSPSDLSDLGSPSFMADHHQVLLIIGGILAIAAAPFKIAKNISGPDSLKDRKPLLEERIATTERRIEIKLITLSSLRPALRLQRRSNRL